MPNIKTTQCMHCKEFKGETNIKRHAKFCAKQSFQQKCIICEKTYPIQELALHELDCLDLVEAKLLSKAA